MMVNTAVSVLILAYNHEKYIEETLKGVVKQKTDFKFECYVHDDASTDSTQEIIQSYAEAYPDIIKPYFQKENQFSLGVKPLTKFIYPLLKSKYVAYCEGDDYWTDELKLSKQVSYLENNPQYSFCCHDVNIIFEEGVPVKRSFYQKPKDGGFNVKFIDEFLNHFIATPTIVAKKDLILNIPVNDNLVSGDIYTLLYLLSHADGYYMQDKMAVKRRNPGGMTLNKTYREKADVGRYRLWKEVLHFAPVQIKPLVRTKIAEYDRLFIKSQKSTPFSEMIKILYQAINNDPYWFVGLSSSRKRRLISQIKG
ncbi:MAG: hypothetical protein CMP53_01085 [Flavobacteriales bacterium]|nr:hypothetical protein [Flavobacteriales bacterium]|tara:strand:- start:4190 stop:5116 length:927 start_codon:yes stop_codon:yes gene_type:complete